MVSLINKFFAKYATLSALLFATILPQAVSAQQQWSMGYWEGYDNTPITSLDGQWGGLTHIAFVAIGTDANGNVTSTDPAFSAHAPQMISDAHSNGVKVLIDFEQIQSDQNLNGAVANHLSTLIANIMSVVNQYGFDGVVVDWENTLQSAPQSSINNFFSALRTALGSKILAADAFPCCGSIDRIWSPVVQYLDRLDTMTYDLGVPNESGATSSWFNSPLYADSAHAGDLFDNGGWSIVNSLGMHEQYANIAASKLNFGIPFYGESISGASGPRQGNGSGLSVNQTNYSSVLAKYGATTVNNATYDSVAQVPWINTGSNSYLSFDNAKSVAQKVAYAKANHNGGWILFSLNKDYVSSAPAGQQHPLLAAVQAAMGTSSNSETAPSITSTSPLSAGTVGTPYSLAVTGSGSTPMTWAVTSGALPGGLSLNSSTGMISGTPGTPASSSFTVEAANAMGNSSRQFSLTVNAKATTSSWFNVVSKNSGKCLDVPGMSTSENVQLQQFTCGSGDNQKFQFTPVKGGYEVTVKNSGLQMNVRGGASATQNGAAIIQWPYSGYPNETWNTVPNVDGSYSITVLSSGKCVDVSGSSTSNGAEIQQWQCTGNANQKWTLVPVN